jgi:ATP-binding cassette subfamily B protein
MACGIGWQALNLAIPVLVGEALDHGVFPRRVGPGLLWAFAVLVAAIGSGLCAGGRNYLALVNGARAETSLRDRLVGSALRQPTSFHDRVGVGDILSRVSSDAKAAARPAEFAGHGAGLLFGVAATSTILIVLEPRLGLIAASIVPVAVVALVVRGSGRYETIVRRRQAQRATAAQMAEQGVSAARMIQGLGAGPALAARFELVNAEIVESGVVMGRMDATLQALLQTIPLLVVAAVFVIGSGMVAAGRLSPGHLVVFSSYEGGLAASFAMLGEDYRWLRQALASEGRLLDVLVHERIPEGEVPWRPAGAPELRLHGVTFAYPGGEPVLSQLDLTIPSASVVVVVGGMGAGKSTLVSLLVRLYDPPSGQITIDGRDLRDVRFDDLRGCMGVVFQQPVFIHDTVLTNLTLFHPEASTDEVEAAATTAGIHETIMAMPDGYASVVGEGGRTLSGGQRQRLALARALVANPPLLLVDEPTAAVDARREQELALALRAAFTGRTAVVVSRRPAILGLADRVVVLDEGRIAEDGTHRQLVRHSQRYRHLIGQSNPAPGRLTLTPPRPRAPHP